MDDDEPTSRKDRIDPNYAMAMKERGINWDTLSVIRKVSCPNCGFMFSLTYARTIACRGCPMATKNCPKVRCAKCDHEFYMKEMGHVGTSAVEHRVASHMSDIETAYNEQLGRKRHA